MTTALLLLILWLGTGLFTTVVAFILYVRERGSITVLEALIAPIFVASGPLALVAAVVALTPWSERIIWRAKEGGQ